MSSDHDERYRPAAPAWATVPTMPWQKVINTDDDEEPSGPHARLRQVPAGPPFRTTVAPRRAHRRRVSHRRIHAGAILAAAAGPPAGPPPPHGYRIAQAARRCQHPASRHPATRTQDPRGRDRAGPPATRSARWPARRRRTPAPAPGSATARPATPGSTPDSDPGHRRGPPGRAVPRVARRPGSTRRVSGRRTTVRRPVRRRRTARPAQRPAAPGEFPSWAGPTPQPNDIPPVRASAAVAPPRPQSPRRLHAAGAGSAVRTAGRARVGSPPRRHRRPRWHQRPHRRPRWRPRPPRPPVEPVSRVGAAPRRRGLVLVAGAVAGRTCAPRCRPSRCPPNRSRRTRFGRSRCPRLRSPRRRARRSRSSGCSRVLGSGIVGAGVSHSGLGDSRFGSAGATPASPDPEQILATFEWVFDPETLREVVEDEDGLERDPGHADREDQHITPTTRPGPGC